MFGLYFGNYLMEKNKISPSHFKDLMQQQQKTRVKLGIIAVAEKLLTTKQAEEINDLQRKMDRRFGDIAIEKGYLLPEEVTHLLNMQGNPYLQFVQVCTESNLMTLQQIEQYIDEFKKDYKLSDSDIEALKSGDIDRIVPVFADTDVPFSGKYISLAIRNTVRFINNNVLLKKSYKVNDYSFGSLACQRLVGDHELFIGLACKDKELLQIASPFAKEEFTRLDEDAFDSVCEFINCINGLYASKLSHEDIHIDMTPPLFYEGKKVASKGDIYVMPVIINGEQSDLLVAVDQPVSIM